MKQVCMIVLLTILCSHYTLIYGQNPFDQPRAYPIPIDQNQSGSQAPLDAQGETKQGHSFLRPQNSPMIPSFQNAQSNLFQSDGTSPQIRTCFTVENEQKLREKYAGRLSTDDFEARLSRQLALSRMSADPETIYQIPTIVHVVHSGEPRGTGSNISREQIMSQFDVLNEDFRRLGAGYNEHPDGADINIEFVPVLTDPYGNLLEEPGVDRISGYSSSYSYTVIEEELKPNTQWDPYRFFNIWVLDFGSSGLLGYAQFPNLSGLDGLPEDGFDFTDGIVIGYQFFGRTGQVSAPFDLGRTTTHEVGHWLGLRHIWGDGGCDMDDYCEDTPVADGPNRSCETRDSCPGGGPDMIENYMDYSTDGCMNIFTKDQRMRMRTVMEMSPMRNALIVCQLAPPAVAGSNTAEMPLSWYEYTAADHEVVTISSMGAIVDTKLSLFRECHTLPISESDDAYGTQQSELSIALQAGETIKILWENRQFDPFTWQLTTSTPEEGAACGVAAMALEGNNTLPTTSLGTYWYRFSPDADHQKITISAGDMTFNVYGNDCNQLKYIKGGKGTLTMFDVSADQSLFISFEPQGGNVDWTLHTTSIRSGEACSDAVNAMEGQNTIPYEAPFEYWYTFTMPATGNLTLHSAETSTESVDLKVFNECGGFLLGSTAGDGVELTTALEEGETVKIVWESASAVAGYEWVLIASPFENGEVCSVAREVQAGLNHTDGAPQWFSFTTTKRSNLVISSIGLTDVNTHLMIKRECHGQIFMDNDEGHDTHYDFYDQAQLVLYMVPAGETFYILWSEKWSYEGFDWTIEEIDPLPGDNCGTAVQAHTGTNQVTVDRDHYYFGHLYWNKYTVPANGKTITAFSSEPVEMAIFVNNDCQLFSWVDSGQGKGRAVNLPAGTELVFIWSLDYFNENFTWELTVENIQAGDHCESPISAVKGDNISESAPVWYDYQMAEDGSLKVSYQGDYIDGSPFVAILDGCTNADLLYSGVGEAFVSGLSKGQEVSIYWSINYPFPGIKWKLEEIPVRQGDRCEDPLVANYGLNHAEYATHWFTYNVETAGNYTISSMPFTYSNTLLSVYDGCDGNLLASNDNILVLDDWIEYFQSSVTLENLEVGQTLLIKWDGAYSYEAFNWEIVTDQPRPGDSCEDPLLAVEGVNNGMRPMPAWFTFTMPETNSFSVSSVGYTSNDTYVEIYDVCDGELIAYSYDYGGDPQSFAYLPELEAGQTVYIRWANSMNSAQYSFDWKLFVGDPELGIFCESPDQAHEGVNTVPDYVSNFYWFSYTMPEDNKKLVISRLDLSTARYRTIGVTPECSTLSSYAISEDRVEVKGLMAGDEVLIFFGELIDGTRPGFDWGLEIVEMESGDHCDTAIEVLPGLYEFRGAPKWYEYTLPKAGDVTLTSIGLNNVSYANSYIEVYDACDGNLIAANDDPENVAVHSMAEVIIEDLEAGQKLLIKWGSEPFQTDFNWMLSVAADNEAPTLADHHFSLSKFTTGHLIGALSAEDPDDDELVYQITDGNEDGAFSLSNTGELRIADVTKLPAVGGERTLTVSVSDRIAQPAEATLTVDMVLAVEQQHVGVVVFPNPATDRLYLRLASQVQVYESYFVDLTGRIVQVNNARETEISLLGLRQGIYFLKLQTTNGPVDFRVMVK
ncbi:M43 family zinc metalloprotease [Marinoscillum sp. 108]|uniref:M43 family zinc metalloprotease n=1 Tax=Marinoscillum sp. 108 TaxID=2653151 RepID=UPI0012F2B93C|nr:M43 family zinc metalloprotease [Marinoscillum sp. 108]VXD11924.1 exported hypothetical protein [Marinoscillum sp. 108]